MAGAGDVPTKPTWIIVALINVDPFGDHCPSTICLNLWQAVSSRIMTPANIRVINQKKQRPIQIVAQIAIAAVAKITITFPAPLKPRVCQDNAKRVQMIKLPARKRKLWKIFICRFPWLSYGESLDQCVEATHHVFLRHFNIFQNATYLC